MKSGILLLAKSPGMTSFDCIRRLKKVWDRSDLGHGGTLDRFASGLLPILMGDALKLARFFLESYPNLPTYWKTYSGTISLGTATDTGDPEGKVIETRPTESLLLGLTREKVARAMATFVGTPYEQMPPRYSAKKIGGERSSDLARKGLEPELKPVMVTIKHLECTGLDGGEIHFTAICSKGTYMRVLAEDLARKLDSVAHVKELRRTAVGDFLIEDALTLEQVETRSPEECVLDMARATSFIPTFPLLPNELELIRVGKVDGVAARLANSGLGPNVYRAVFPNGNETEAAAWPVALFELTAEKRASFLRAFAPQNRGA